MVWEVNIMSTRRGRNTGYTSTLHTAAAGRRPNTGADHLHCILKTEMNMNSILDQYENN